MNQVRKEEGKENRNIPWVCIYINSKHWVTVLSHILVTSVFSITAKVLLKMQILIQEEKILCQQMKVNQC